MLSCPPAMTISASLHFKACTPRAIAFMPEPQSMFTDVAGTSNGIFAFIEACLAGFWPWPREVMQTIKYYTSTLYSFNYVGNLN